MGWHPVERPQGNPAGVNGWDVWFELNQQLLALVHQPAFAAVQFRLAAGVGAEKWHRLILAAGGAFGRFRFRSAWYISLKKLLLQ